jgi:peptidoglycan glycosyltransferase
MINIICEISKYLILVFMALYTIKCFSYFTAKDTKSRNKNLNKQIAYILLIHFFCYMVLFLRQKEMRILYLYLAQLVVTICYILIFHRAYKKASRLITNNMSFLLLIGYTMLTRLDFSLALRQFVLATAALFITSFIPYILGKMKNLKDWNVAYGIVGLVLLITVFIPGIGKEVYGSRNWIKLGSISLQPMEFVKILFIFFVASGLVKAKTLKDIIVNAAIAVAFMLVLVLEKDLGAMVLFYICYVMMVYLATSRPVFLIGGVGLGVAAAMLGYVLFRDTLFRHVMVRVAAWQDPWANQNSGGYQVCQSLFAIGTGGFVGSGLGKGMPYLIPVAESDFIFSAICEELGVLFGLALILIFVSTFIAITNIAMKCKRPFFKYVAFGIAVCLIFQVLLNIGGVTKFIPSTGVTLPLVSYGVSSVFSTLIMFAIVQYTYILVNKEAEKIEKEKARIRAGHAGNERVLPQGEREGREKPNKK